MAVQPDKRSWEAQVAAAGGTLTERFRVGPWTLRAAERDQRPSSFVLRSDRPGVLGPGEGGVSRNPHDGWTIYDGDARFSSHESPLRCLEWWAERKK